MGKELKITLKKSLIGKSEKQRRVIRGLGLRKLNGTVIRKDTPEIRGMIEKVKFMLHVEEG
ncbi:MAG: 50S ribosomal protein L30 [Deltaproteobacteria bacterium]|nr:50S ribosomal protein L30 [Deltaproteobacteria bacterium]NIS77006.1 50S ribosomal protein L30 [Deltaproteobacteria bacterium]